MIPEGWVDASVKSYSKTGEQGSDEPGARIGSNEWDALLADARDKNSVEWQGF